MSGPKLQGGPKLQVGRFTLIDASRNQWGVAMPGDTRLREGVEGSWQIIRRRGKRAQWVKLGKVVKYMSESNETVYQVASRGATVGDGKAPPGRQDSEDAGQDDDQGQDAPPPPPTSSTSSPGSDDDTATKLSAGDLKALLAASRDAAWQAGRQAGFEAAKAECDRRGVVQTTVHKVELTKPDGTKVELTGAHRQTADLIRAVQASLNVMLVGPAGSGKTTAAMKVAEALGVPFSFTGAVIDRFALLGFRTASGEIVQTQFTNAIRGPGVFLFDENDASAPDANLAFNAALANRVADLPEGKVAVHPECRFIAACNTYGRGADRMYVGRNPLDAATLDRYAIIDWDYDQDLEAQLPAPLYWLARVHKVRAAVQELKVRHVVSTRAIVDGAKLLAAGFNQKQTEELVLWRGLDADARAKVERAIV